MVEPNAGSSCGGMPGTDILGRLFQSAPVIGDFLRAVGGTRRDAMRSVADLMFDRLRDAGQPPDALVAVTVTELREEFEDPNYHIVRYSR